MEKNRGRISRSLISISKLVGTSRKKENNRIRMSWKRWGMDGGGSSSTATVHEFLFTFLPRTVGPGRRAAGGTPSFPRSERQPVGPFLLIAFRSPEAACQSLGSLAYSLGADRTGEERKGRDGERVQSASTFYLVCGG